MADMAAGPGLMTPNQDLGLIGSWYSLLELSVKANTYRLASRSVNRPSKGCGYIWRAIR